MVGHLPAHAKENHPDGSAATPPKEGNQGVTGKQLPLVYKSPPKTPSKYLATAFSIHDYEKREPSQVHVAAAVIWAGVS